jgi:dihydropteroate synthase
MNSIEQKNDAEQSNLSEWQKALGCEPPWIVGVLNITPDSFSDGGQFLDSEAAIARGRELFEEGAHIVDLGAESTRPGAVRVSEEEEAARLLPVVSGLAEYGMLSIDTYKARIAARCLALGARMINDVSGLRGDPEMPRVIRSSGAGCVIMYSKQSGDAPHVDRQEARYQDIVAEISSFLLQQAEKAVAAGVPADRILLDPGMGAFVSTNPDDSWELLARMRELCERLRPFPVYLGISRKGFLGGALRERDPLSQFLAAVSVERGAAFIRTHNVQMAREFFAVQHKIRPGSGERR